MLNLYPFIKNNVIFREKNNADILAFHHSDVKKISKDAWEIYKLCRGDISTEEIITKLNKSWDIDHDQIFTFFKEAENMGLISFMDRPKRGKINYLGKKYRAFPSRATIVVTDKCNLRCIYCYDSCDPLNDTFLPHDKIADLFRRLRSIGVLVIEISGGEPLAHPYFNTILKEAIENFQYISILTNGTLFDDGVFDLIEENKHKISIQISIDGASEKTNAIVRQKGNTWNVTLKNIKKLVQLEARLKVAYMVVNENKDEASKAVEILRESGVKYIVFSTPDNLGRGSTLRYPDQSTLSDMQSPYFKEIGEMINKVTHENKDIVLDSDKIPHSTNIANCGAGWDSITIKPSGNIIACTIQGESSNLIGNVFEDNLEDLFHKSPLVKFYRNFNKSISDKDCLDCNYLYYCNNCITKIYIANKDRLSRGMQLCPIAWKSNMEKILNFQGTFDYSI